MGTMLVTSFLTFFVIRYQWRYALPIAIGATGFFVLFDLVFFAAAMHKLFEGGWFPLLLATAVFTVMITWRRGRVDLGRQLRAASLPLRDFLQSVLGARVHRVSGTAIFLTSAPDATPHSLLHSLKHYKVMHEKNVFLHVQFDEVPWIAPEEGISCEALGHDCWRVTVRYGFMDRPDVPLALERCGRWGLQVDPMDASFFLSREKLVPAEGVGMARWRDRLFAAMARNAGSVTDFFEIPPNRVVELGARIEI
jgi:KUP system potassium uptake protein